MKKVWLYFWRGMQIGMAVVLICSVLVSRPVLADSPPPTRAPLIITEIQPGTAASASEEFIEIYNTTSQAIDLGTNRWQLEVASSTASNWETPLRVIGLDGTILPGQSYLVASTYKVGGQTVHYLASTAQRWFSAGIAASAGHVRLTVSAYQPQPGDTCELAATVVDEVEWSTMAANGLVTPSLDGRTVLGVGSVGVSKSSSIQRLTDPMLHTYLDTDADAQDLGQAPPTAGLTNALVSSPMDEPSGLLPADACDPNQPTAPSAEPPEPPITPTVPGSGGETASPPDPAMPPPDVPNAGLIAPRITEVLPNPALPQTDSTDEFIELYNPNDQPFDLTGFVLEAGAVTKHRYTFSVGDQLPPFTYGVFTAAATGLSLANSGGQVQLIDASGVVVSITEIYETAPDGQAWIYQDNVWQWSTTPTPGEPNVLTTSEPAVKRASSSAVPAAPKKTAAVKAVSTKTTKTPAKSAKPDKKAKSSVSTLASASTTAAARNPLPLGILAAVGVFALLYAAYEYRQDIVHTFHRLRGHRAARRKNRPPITRRRSY